VAEALLTVAAVATMYTDIGPLYCGGHTSTTQEPWLALPISQLGTTWQCGDLYYLRFSDGTTLMARALDAGPFAKYCVQLDNNCLPIVADIPQAHAPFPGLSIPIAQMFNITAEVRRVH